MKAGLGLGSNKGDRLAEMQAAKRFVTGLSASGEVRVSSLYETEPVACPPGSGAFLNAVIEIDYGGSARSLWQEISRYEFGRGRIRSGLLNEPRVMDVDLLYFGNTECREPDLVIPHPRMMERRFVLEPLAEIRPGLVLPGMNQTVAEVLTGLPEGGGKVRLWRREW
jgi:2-amino-4-hydroxy-6-hydroxymethyldihydropteridine diphosphokinase